LAELGEQVRRLGAQSVVTSQAVADRFDLHTTDLEVLDVILLEGQASAGRLAVATGLTSGSVTALIDRLEKRGYVERRADPTDRRRTLVRVRPDAIAPIAAIYEPMQARMHQLWSTYSISELRVIIDFLSRSRQLAVVCTEAIRQHPPARR
jgi:DNA-binding MarR family transcriptional regulator